MVIICGELQRQHFCPQLVSAPAVECCMMRIDTCNEPSTNTLAYTSHECSLVCNQHLLGALQTSNKQAATCQAHACSARRLQADPARLFRCRLANGCFYILPCTLHRQSAVKGSKASSCCAASMQQQTLAAANASQAVKQKRLRQTRYKAEDIYHGTHVDAGSGTCCSLMRKAAKVPKPATTHVPW